MIESSVSEKLRILHKMQIEVPCYGAQPRGLSTAALSRPAIPGAFDDVLSIAGTGSGMA
jgi:hypothetical protein